MFIVNIEEESKVTPDSKFVAVVEMLVRDTYLYIRLFGNAYAVGGFIRAYTGPVQIDWGVITEQGISDRIRLYRNYLE